MTGTSHRQHDQSLAQALPARRLLYVEDNSVNVLVMQGLLAHRPQWEMTIAVNGEDGFVAARDHLFDLLLFDLHLPDCDGTEVLRRLRAVDGLKPVPAVVVTAADVDLQSSGFIECWPKPLDLHHVLQRMDTLLGGDPPEPFSPSAPGTLLGPLDRRFG